MNTGNAQLRPGLENPVLDSQKIFRQLLTGMSEPGVISTVQGVIEHPMGLFPATYAIALTLFDQDTRIFLSDNMQQNEISDSLRFHSSISQVSLAADADFVICNESDRPDLDQLNWGTEAYPDQSCTLIIQCRSFFQGIVYRATGPGIKGSSKICSSAFNGTLLHQREKLSSRFPLGIDLILTSGRDFFCIPRTTKLVVVA